MGYDGGIVTLAKMPGKKEGAVICLDTALGSFQTSQYLLILIIFFSATIKILSIWTSTDLGWFSAGSGNVAKKGKMWT